MGLEVEGISFHVGTGCSNPDAHKCAIEDASILLEGARSLGHNMRVLDIGGGFTTKSFDRAAEEIRSSLIELKHNFPDIQVIAEPGRLFANDVFSLAVQVIGRRGTDSDSEERRLYLNDGVFGNFMNCVFEKASYKPIAVVHSGEMKMAGSEGGYSYSLWGPTCDCDDCIAREAQFGQEVEIGDWLIFEGVGAYTNVCQTGFNGFDTASETLYAS